MEEEHSSKYYRPNKKLENGIQESDSHPPKL